MVTSSARLARASTATTATAVAALPVTVGCVIGHAYLAATAALLLSAAAGGCGWVLAGHSADRPRT